MILFNADDYGITETQSRHILECRSGCLTGVSVMPNSPFLDKTIEAVADDRELHAAVHLNLTEGLCLSDPSEIPLLARPTGRFYPSFGRLLLISLTPKRGELTAQIQRELTKQIVRVRELLPDRPLWLDGHQHIQMIPAVADAIARAVLAGGWPVEHMRWSCEPLRPYLRKVSFWKDYRPVNIVKNIVLNTLSLFARKHMRRMGLRCNLVMGLVVSGDMELRYVRALLPEMERIAARRGKDLELVMHPGWGIRSGEGLDVPGGVFEKFYLDPGRKKEYDCLRELFRDNI